MKKKQSFSTTLILVSVLFFLITTLACSVFEFSQEKATPTNLIGQASPTPFKRPVPIATNIPQVIISNPTANQQFYVDQVIDVISLSTDQRGIIRVELIVNNQIVVSNNNPNSQSTEPYLVSQAWQAKEPGLYTIQVRAYSSNNKMGKTSPLVLQILSRSSVTATAITIDATSTTFNNGTNNQTPNETVTSSPTTSIPTDTPSSTPESLTPTPTETPTYPYLIVLSPVNLEVRSGPNSKYEVVGALVNEQAVKILGQNDIGEGTWWQIRYPTAPNSIAWLPGNTSLTSAYNTLDLETIVAPPTPTDQAAIATATSTPTPRNQTAEIIFTANRSIIKPGQCVQLSWHVTHVKEVYFQGEGVPGGDQQRTDCPTETTIYTLRVVKLDNSQERKLIEVRVRGDATWHQTLELRANMGVDFDNGGVVSNNGDDFTWYKEGNEFIFEKWDDDSDLKLVWLQSGTSIALDDLSYSLCEWTFESYNQDRLFVIVGDIVCFITDDGRPGKLRFDRLENDRIIIQWQTW